MGSSFHAARSLRVVLACGLVLCVTSCALVIGYEDGVPRTDASTSDDATVDVTLDVAPDTSDASPLDAPVDALHRKQFAALAPAELAELQRLLQKARERR